MADLISRAMVLCMGTTRSIETLVQTIAARKADADQESMTGSLRHQDYWLGRSSGYRDVLQEIETLLHVDVYDIVHGEDV